MCRIHGAHTWVNCYNNPRGNNKRSNVSTVWTNGHM
jgi:hypothetical protein